MDAHSLTYREWHQNAEAASAATKGSRSLTLPLWSEAPITFSPPSMRHPGDPDKAALLRRIPMHMAMLTFLRSHQRHGMYVSHCRYY